MLKVTERAVELGFSIMWDADVSNKNFQQKNGFAVMQKEPSLAIGPENEELKYDQEMRQQLFENLTTQDDHLMHIVGIEKTGKGKKFFLVKNSWGEVGPFKGMIHVSEAYFAINTISLVVPKAALDVALKSKLGIK
jgi:bleomycin hydrolase